VYSNKAVRKITSDGTVSTIVDGRKSTIQRALSEHLVLDNNIFTIDYDHSIKQITMDGIVTNTYTRMNGKLLLELLFIAE
jgi:hypothetical protein